MQCVRGKYYMLNCNGGKQRPMFEIHPRSAAFPLLIKKLLHLSYLTKLAITCSSKPYCIQGSAESSLTATLDY